MIRNLTWATDQNSVGAALLSPERAAQFDQMFDRMVEEGLTLREMFDIGAELDLTENEWTAFVYSLGMAVGKENQPRPMIPSPPPALATPSVPQSPPQTTRVLWLDLDSTVRHGKDELGYFATGADDVRIFDHVPEILAAYKGAGWRIVGVSNQGGIALGHIKMEDVMEMSKRTQQLCGGVFDMISACPHHPDSPDPLVATCWCRKPGTGMLTNAAQVLSQRHNETYPPILGLFVGDRDEDRECAANAHTPFMEAAKWRAGAWRQGLLPVPGIAPLSTTIVIAR
jgi:D-glycero-D-manno-heptose 1,7-bisphosphate phosphatase